MEIDQKILIDFKFAVGDFVTQNHSTMKKPEKHVVLERSYAESDDYAAKRYIISMVSGYKSFENNKVARECELVLYEEKTEEDS
jgi:hypothetical protein